MAKNSQSLHHVAREAARIAITGATNSRIQSHIADTAPGLDTTRLGSTVQYRAWDENAGAWSAWMTLTDDGTENVAASGDQIRVDLRYSYDLASGAMFRSMLGASADNSMSLSATVVAMSE